MSNFKFVILSIASFTLFLYSCKVDPFADFKGMAKSDFNISPIQNEYFIGQPITIKSNGSVGVLSWNLGSGAEPSNSESQDSVRLRFINEGDKTVRLQSKIGDNVPVSKAISLKVIKAILIATFKTSESLTVGKEITFESASFNKSNPAFPPDKIEWKFEQGSVSPTMLEGMSVKSPILNEGLLKLTLTVKLFDLSSDDTVITFNITKPTPKPIASFTVSNDSCIYDCSVQFTNTSANAISFTWDFGDGTPISSLSSPNHMYLKPGTYIVKMIAQNLAGDTNSIKIPVYIRSGHISKTYSLSTISIKNPIVVERQDRLLHVVFQEGNNFRSVILDRYKGIKSISTLNLNYGTFLNSHIINSRGDIFLLFDGITNDNKFKVFKVNNEGSIVMDKELSFNSIWSRHEPLRLVINSSDNLIILGNVSDGKNVSTGYIRISEEGLIVKNVVCSYVPSDLKLQYPLGNFRSYNIFQLHTGDYILISHDSKNRLYHTRFYESEIVYPSNITFNKSISNYFRRGATYYGIGSDSLLLLNDVEFIFKYQSLQSFKYGLVSKPLLHSNNAGYFLQQADDGDIKDPGENFISKYNFILNKFEWVKRIFPDSKKYTGSYIREVKNGILVYSLKTNSSGIDELYLAIKDDEYDIKN